MLPPEGATTHNYYVFSRNPLWGWGHGHQVLHESLSMLAYAYFDPVSAMESQRVYMEQQRADGLSLTGTVRAGCRITRTKECQPHRPRFSAGQTLKFTKPAPTQASFGRRMNQVVAIPIGW